MKGNNIQHLTPVGEESKAYAIFCMQKEICQSTIWLHISPTLDAEIA